MHSVFADFTPHLTTVPFFQVLNTSSLKKQISVHLSVEFDVFNDCTQKHHILRQFWKSHYKLKNLKIGLPRDRKTLKNRWKSAKRNFLHLRVESGAFGVCGLCTPIDDNFELLLENFIVNSKFPAESESDIPRFQKFLIFPIESKRKDKSSSITSKLDLSLFLLPNPFHFRSSVRFLKVIS